MILIAKGFCIGMADIVPGVSGGTMAWILGVYERLIAGLRSFDADLLRALLKGRGRALFTRPHWGVLLPLGVGVTCALFFFTRVISLPGLIRDYPSLIYGLFFGLVGGSIVILFKGVRLRGVADAIWIGAGICAGAMLLLYIPVNTPETTEFIFLCGALAIGAMLLPGISGSFLLLLLGKYGFMLEALAQLRISVILPFVLGIGCGLILFSRVIGYMLQAHHRQTVLTMNGLLMGSMWALWPFQDRAEMAVDGQTVALALGPIFPDLSRGDSWLSLLCIAVGALIVLSFHRLAGRKI